MSAKQINNYEGMDLVKKGYAESNLTDTQFAAQMSEKTNRLYSCAQVRSYRQALGIPNNGVPMRDPKLVYVVIDGAGQPVAVYMSLQAAETSCAENRNRAFLTFELL